MTKFNEISTQKDTDYDDKHHFGLYILLSRHRPGTLFNFWGVFLNKKEPRNYLLKSIYMLSLDKEFIKYLVSYLKILLFEMSGM